MVAWHAFSREIVLAELRRRAPHAIDWAPLQDDIVPMLDAFEAAQDTSILLRG